jgi:AcrR family transcriptional regulator
VHSPPDSTPPIDDRIVHASLTLINEHGLSGVTMSQIAETAGVARQTLYNRYGDIESIVAATIERHHRESIDLLGITIGIAESPTDKLEQMVRHFAAMGAHSQHSLELRGALAEELRASLDAYQNVVEGHIMTIIADGQETGAFRSNLSPEFDSKLLRSLLEGVSGIATHSPDQAAEIATAGTRTIISALT